MAQAQHVTPKIEGTAVVPTRVLSTSSITSRTWVSMLFGFLPLSLTWKARLTLAKLSMGEYHPFQYFYSSVRDSVSFGYLAFSIAREECYIGRLLSPYSGVLNVLNTFVLEASSRYGNFSSGCHETMSHFKSRDILLMFCRTL